MMDTKNIDAIYPLSPVQQGILFHSSLTRDADPYLGQIGITLTGALDPGAFERSWQALVDRHPILRTAFTTERRGRPLQVVLKSMPIDVRHLDWRNLDTGEQQLEMERYLAADRKQGCDPASAPLMRLALIRLAAERHRLIWTEHHLLLDGWSVPLILNELSTLYAAESKGQTVQLLPARPYRDYIDWLAKQDRPAAENYWRGLLTGFRAPTSLSIARHDKDKDKDGGSSDHGVQTIQVEAATLGRLRNIARANRVTFNTLVQSAWVLLLARYSGQDDIVYGATTSGRPADLDGVEGIAGPFINTLPVRLRIAPGERIGQLLRRMQEQQLETQRFEYTPLVDIQSWAGVAQGDALFENIYVFENYPAQRESSGDGGLAMSEVAALEQSSFPFALVVGASDRLTAKALYAAGRFDDAFVAALLLHFQTILERIAQEPNQRIADLDMLTAGERRRILKDWNCTATGYPRHSSIPDLFEERVRLRPASIALEWDAQTMCYGELDRQANQLAHFLREKGVGPEQVVGVRVDRGPRLIVALLAILKAGGAYLPLDGNNPRARLDYMLAESGVQVIVGEEKDAPLLAGAAADFVWLDRDAASIARYPAESLPRETGPRHLAYVMYTSGSTGKPKGTGIEHRSVARLVKNTGYVSFSQDDVFLQFAPLAFDASTFEIWGSLLNGARLVLFPPHLPSLAELGQTIAGTGVTTLWLTAGLFHHMVDAHAGYLRGVRQLIAGGEALPIAMVRKALADLPHTLLVNGYGPTENCTFTCCHKISLDDAQGQSIPIGRPIANTQAYILDPQFGLTAPGLAGELYAGGDGLARDYRNRPDLTAERFLPNPFSAEPGARLYSTGDRARYRSDGAIEFLGRIDGQVKIRGFRIEMEEIEAVLAQHPSVRQGAAGVRESESGDSRIVAFVVLHPDAPPSLDGLREFLKSQLPTYMVPALILQRESLPLTSNGKVDRRALTSEQPAGTALETETPVPQSPIEEVLAGVWRELFRLPAVGRNDDFFSLGGNSLLAMQAISRIRDLLPAQLPLRAIFEHTTLAGLSAEIERLMRADAPESAPLERAPRSAEMPLSLAQQRLWFLDRLEPGNTFYNMHLAFRLRGKLCLEALEASLQDIGLRHESLRTQFPDRDGEPVQSILPAPRFRLEIIRHSPSDGDVRHIADRQAHRPFDLAQDPLFRPILIRLGETDHILLLAMHHVISDGQSVGVLLEELSQLYTARTTGANCELSPLPMQYLDYAVWERQWLNSPDMSRLTAYWKQRLNNPPAAIRFTSARPRPDKRSFGGETYSWMLPGSVSETVDTLSRREGVTKFMVLLGAYYILLRHHTGQDDLIVGADVANRNHPETQRMIGFFVNQLPLRADLSGDPSFRAFLGRVRESTLGAYAHHDLPFQKLLDVLKVERRLNHAALFQAKLLYQQGPAAALEFSGVEVEPFRVELNSSAFDLVLALLETPHGLAATFEFDTDLLDRPAVVRMSEDFQALLTRAAAQPDTTLGELSAQLAEMDRKRHREERRIRDAAGFRLLRNAKPVPVSS